MFFKPNLFNNIITKSPNEVSSLNNTVLLELSNKYTRHGF